MVEFRGQHPYRHLVPGLVDPPSGRGRPQKLELLRFETDFNLRPGQSASLLDGEKAPGAFAAQPDLGVIADGEVALTDLDSSAERKIDRHLFDEKFSLDLESDILAIQLEPPSRLILAWYRGPEALCEDPMSRYHLPPDFDETSLSAGLGRGHAVVVAPETTLTATPLDTFDWRLYRAGLVLVEELAAGRRLVLLERDREPYCIATRTTPRVAADLPAGHLADSIGPLMGIRSLIALGAARIDRREGRIDNADGEMLARLRFETVQPLDENGKPLPAFRTLEIRGGAAAAKLGCTNGLTAAAWHDLDALAAARGRAPGDYSSKFRVDLDPHQPAEEAVRAILLVLLTTLEANVDGTVKDIDPEFLHDLRVACRRTRSALTQLKRALDSEVTASFNSEFKRLGGLTGPLRDLDVFLLEMPAYRANLPSHASADLEPLEALIRTARTRALASVSSALRAPRFKRLVASWRETLEDALPSSGPQASRSALDFANKRITRAHRRILEHGRGLDDDPPAEALHRLRIDAKKLRYLLEFFHSLYPATEIDTRIKELKGIQDILGGFNDMEVQRDRLSAFARELRADPGVSTSCILTLGRLAGTLEERQEEFRSALHDAFTRFESAPVKAAFRHLFGRKESK